MIPDDINPTKSPFFLSSSSWREREDLTSYSTLQDCSLQAFLWPQGIHTVNAVPKNKTTKGEFGRNEKKRVVTELPAFVFPSVGLRCVCVCVSVCVNKSIDLHKYLSVYTQYIFAFESLSCAAASRVRS